MDSSNYATAGNTVRAPGAPFARPRTALSRKLSINRESSALRASVLDVAMQIGLGTNGAVTDWIYNNSVNEEEEDSVSSPSLTNSSSATSEESSSARFPYSPPSSSRSISSSTRSLFSPHKPFTPGTLPIPEELSFIAEEIERLPTTPVPSTSTSITFSEPTMPLPSFSVRLPAKLKKRRPDGYESDGGYVSDAKSKKKDRKGKLGGGITTSVHKTGENSGTAAIEEKARSEWDKETARQRAKSLIARGNGFDTKADNSPISKGYETDAPTRKRFGRKKKSSTPDPYETDAEYLSSANPVSGLKKAKTRFFGLGGKSSKPTLTESASKDAPPIPLPIAQKFGTTLGNNGMAALPVLPSLPSLDPVFTSPVTPQQSTSQTTTSLVSPSSTVSGGPEPRLRSESTKKDLLSDKGTRDSHVSGESSRSSTSNSTHEIPRRKGFRFLSSAKSSPTLSSSKFPVISLPLTRATSPAPPDTSKNGVDRSPDGPEFTLPDVPRSPSPSPSKVRSNVQESRGPHISIASPSRHQRPVSPLAENSPSVVISAAASAPSSPAISRTPSLRPRNSNLTVNTGIGLSPVFAKRLSRGRSPSPIPSSDWIMPSPSATSISPSYASSGTLPVPSPNMYSFYDIPPPSPPPNAPLPKVPEAVSNPEDDPFGVNGTSVIGSFSCPDRGKDMPFLARLRTRAGSSTGSKAGDRTLAPMTAGRLSVQPISARSSVATNITANRSSGSSKIEEPYIDDAASGQELQDVIDRFIEEVSNHRTEREARGKALGRRRSSEAFQHEAPPGPDTALEDEGNMNDTDSVHNQGSSDKRRSTLYYSEVDEDGVDPRISRWSGSVYSRASIMDSHKSEDTRARFVKRVEAMLDEAGIERGNRLDWNVVPPVPKLPDALAQSNLLRRQNQSKGAGSTPGVNGWI